MSVKTPFRLWLCLRRIHIDCQESEDYQIRSVNLGPQNLMTVKYGQRNKGVSKSSGLAYARHEDDSLIRIYRLETGDAFM